MSTHEGHQPNQPDDRSAADRQLDQEISALFREAGLALSNGYQPELLGADARQRAAEEESISAVFQSARHLQTGPLPDFRQMAAQARKLARETPGTPQEEELVGELTRSTLRQLPDLEVRCWHVSQAAAMELETAQPVPAAALAAPLAPLAAEPPAAAAAAPVAVLADPAAPRPGEFTAHDMANIRENDWVDFKRRYHRERRRQVLQMAVAGVLGAAACFLVVYLAGFLRPQSATPAALASARDDAGAGPVPLDFFRDRGDASANSAARPMAVSEAPEESVQPVDSASLFGDQEGRWLKDNGPRFNVETVGTDGLFNMPTIFREKAEPNPTRRLGELLQNQQRRANDNVPPELYPDATYGLRLIRLSPRSDFALAALNVNDWITRVIKPDGSEIDLANGSADNLRQWQEFLASQHAGDEFDVEYLRGKLIRRTTITLSGDSR